MTLQRLALDRKYNSSQVIELLRNERLIVLKLAIAALLSIPMLIAFCLHYVHIEDPVYVWDYRGYWVQFQEYGSQISRGSADWHLRLVGAIRDNDYNPSAAIPLFPFYYWFGGGRESYIIAVSLLYLLPTVVIAAAISLRDARGGDGPSAAMAYLAALTYMPFWAPTLRGMVDIVGLIFLGIATLIVLRSDFLQRRPFVNAIALGVMLWAPFLLRRWYAFSIVVFFAAVFFFGVLARWRQNERRVHAFITFGIALGIAGMIVLACIWYLQRGVAERVLVTSYSDLYSSYQMSFVKHLEKVQSIFGWYMLSIIAVGVIAALLETSLTTLFCLACALLTFFLFIRTQAMGPHHFLPVAFWLFPVYFAGLCTCIRWFSFLPAMIRIVPFVAASIIIFVFGASPAFQRSGILGEIFIPKATFRPLHLDNLQEYKRLISDLETNLKDNEKFVVWASSKVLSDELLVTLEPNLASRYLGAPHIAKRDIFRFDMLRAKYAVAVTPAQTHQAPGTQRNITIPGELLLNEEAYGSAFERIGEYNLAEGATAYLFRRHRSVSPDETLDMVGRLIEAYPDWSQKFERSIVGAFTSRDVNLGDVSGRVVMQDFNSVRMQPGATRPISLSMPLPESSGSRPTVIAFSMSPQPADRCTGSDGVMLNVMMDDNAIWNGALIAGSSARVPLPAMGESITIKVDKNLQPICDHVVAKFEF